MSKKILLTLLLSCIIFSCGKKGDPFYKDPETRSKNYIHNVKII